MLRSHYIIIQAKAALILLLFIFTFYNMSEPSKTSKSTNPNIGEAYNRHSPVAERVKAEYENVVSKIFEDLSPDSLEPFAAILLEHENTILNKDTFIERARAKLNKLLPMIHENFFISNDVGNKLITLEVLKEKFEPHKGTDWNVHKLTPEERTRHIRMRFMDSSIRFLQKQIKSQEKALEVAMAKSKANRDRIQSMEIERVKLLALMRQQSVSYKEMSPKLLEQMKVLTLNKTE